jgi:type I restriction enzyme S subunit
MKHRYPKYKNTGVDFIGEIPTNWSFGPMKYVLQNNDGGVWGDDLEEGEEGVIVIRSTEITIDGKWDFSDPIKRKLSQKEVEKSKLKCDDIVITKSSGSPDHIGKSVIVNKDIENLNCCYSNFVQRIRFKNYNPRLYHFVLNSQVVRGQFRYLTQSTTGLGNLNGTTLNEIILPFIPLPEQEQIVKYLDEKTSQIDSLISITEKKIELLKQKRTSLINEVVTKGLNPDVELKDSGVEWIGKIPKHWEVRKMKYCLRLISEKKETTNTDVKISPENVESDTGVCFNLYSDYSGEGMKFERGDILLNKLRIYLKKIVFTDYSGFSMGEMIVLRTIEGVNKYYYHTLFNQGLIDLLNEQSNGVKLPRVSPEIILNTEIVFPPILEQEQIVDFIDTHNTEIDNLISIEKRRIETLKEYRQSLISEVVTGKVRVCEFESELLER